MQLSVCAGRLEVYRNVGVFFPPPQIMRKGGNSSGQMMEVPVVVGGGQGYLFGVNPSCQPLKAGDRKQRCRGWSNDLGGIKMIKVEDV